MKNVRKHRDIKLVTVERRRNYLVSEPNYHTTKIFIELDTNTFSISTYAKKIWCLMVLKNFFFQFQYRQIFSTHFDI